MRTKLYILQHGSGKVGFLVMKEFDGDDTLVHTIEKIRENEPGWHFENGFILDSDIYERLPQYSLISAKRLHR